MSPADGSRDSGAPEVPEDVVEVPDAMEVTDVTEVAEDSGDPDVTGSADVAAGPTEPDALVGRAVRVRRALAATASAVVVLGLTAAVVLADDRLPGPAPVEPLARVVDVPAADQVLVCPGPPRGVTEGPQGEDLVYDPQFDPAPEGSATGLAVAVRPGQDATAAGVGEDGEDATVSAGSVTSYSGGSATTVTVPGGSAGAPAAASVLTRTLQGDMRGLAAAPCARPAAEHWLVGGSTALGSSARLTLQNPGRTPASVTVDMWGPAGPVELAGAPEFLVPAGESRVVLLEGLAAEQRRVVVRTTATGGLVTATLEVGELRGLLPAGADLVTPGAAPAVEQVVVGVDVPRTAADGLDPAVLRLLAPEEAADVEIAIAGPDGPVDLPGAETVRLDAGAVLDVPLGGLPAGAYAITVRSPVPVLAGAMVTRGKSVGATDESVVDPLDRAWLPAQAPGGEDLLAVPPAPRRDLVLAGRGPGRAEAVVTVRTEDGESEVSDVVVAAGATTTVRLAAPGDQAVAVEVTGEDVVWAVVVTATPEDGDLVTAVTPLPGVVARDDLVVLVR